MSGKGKDPDADVDEMEMKCSHSMTTKRKNEEDLSTQTSKIQKRTSASEEEEDSDNYSNILADKDGEELLEELNNILDSCVLSDDDDEGLFPYRVTINPVWGKKGGVISV